MTPSGAVGIEPATANSRHSSVAMTNILILCAHYHRPQTESTNLLGRQPFDPSCCSCISRSIRWLRILSRHVTNQSAESPTYHDRQPAATSRLTCLSPAPIRKISPLIHPRINQGNPSRSPVTRLSVQASLQSLVHNGDGIRSPAHLVSALSASLARPNSATRPASNSSFCTHIFPTSGRGC